MTGQKQRSFTPKDIVALAFSALALTLSGVTFYMTNMRVSDAVSARVVNIRQASRPSPGGRPGEKQDILVVEAVFANSGNRDAIVTLPDFNFSGSRGLEDGAVGGPVAAAEGVFPFILSPKQIRLVDLPVPTAIAQMNLDQGSPLPAGSGDAARRFFLSFVFSAIDSSGNPHPRASGPQLEVDLSATRIHGWRPIRDEVRGRESNFAPTTLFE